jgi:hypothetical protein
MSSFKHATNTNGIQWLAPAELEKKGFYSTVECQVISSLPIVFLSYLWIFFKLPFFPYIFRLPRLFLIYIPLNFPKNS